MPIPELDTSVFIIPGERVKNRQDRLIVLNSTARSVLEEVRGQHLHYVFSYKGNRVAAMHGRAWKRARIAAGLPGVRVHDLKHTYGRRLRSGGSALRGQAGPSRPQVWKDHYALFCSRVAKFDRGFGAGLGTHWHKSGTMVILRKQLRHLQAV